VHLRATFHRLKVKTTMIRLHEVLIRSAVLADGRVPIPISRYATCNSNLLPIKWPIRVKLASLVHKILNTGHPPYLTELLQYHMPARSTRSSVSHLLSESATQPYIWLSRFSRLCVQNIELDHYLFTIASPKHTLPLYVILRRRPTTFFQLRPL